MNAKDAPPKESRNIGDMLFFNLTRGFAAFTLLLLAGIIVSLLISSWESLQKFGFGFLFSQQWNPPAEEFGALIPIYGTIVTSLIALIIAVPVSFGIALFLTELSPVWLRRPLGTAIELLAAIPSIVYGMWGLLVFAPIFAEYGQPFISATLGNLPLIGALFAGPHIGIGLLTAGIILAIMIIPFIASVMRDVFDVVVLPYTKVGVIGGIMLGLGRALGETMAVTFVIGNTNFINNISLYSPGNSITSTLANEFGEATPGLYTASLIELGLILFLITLVVLVSSKLLLLRLAKQQGTEA